MEKVAEYNNSNVEEVREGTSGEKDKAEEKLEILQQVVDDSVDGITNRD